MADRHAEAVMSLVGTCHFSALPCVSDQRGLAWALGSSVVSPLSSQIHLLGCGAEQGNWVATRAGLWQFGFRPRHLWPAALRSGEAGNWNGAESSPLRLCSQSLRNLCFRI